ncbi:MAG: hypothetical protein ACRC7O_15155 [Fimbriiglobus sp.]
MAIRKTGARRISVDGVMYLWRVRQKPTYAQEFYRGITVAIQLAENPGQVLLARGDSRPDKVPIYCDPITIVTPHTVAAAIRCGLAAGWRPDAPGSQFEIALPVANSSDRHEP